MIENWTALLIGIMIIVSPWVLGFSDISLAKWGNILLGLALVITNMWVAFGEQVSQAISTVEEPQKPKRKTKNNNNVE